MKQASYKEQVIDGVLMCRSEPSGEWSPAATLYAGAVNALIALTDEQRERAMRFFCSHCGDVQPTDSVCHCSNGT